MADVQFLLATRGGGRFTLTLSLGVISCEYPECRLSVFQTSGL